MATLQQIIDDIQDATAAVSTNIRAAPDEPPDQMSAYPFVVAFASSGEYSWLPGPVMKGLHNIAVQLHVSHQDQARDVAVAMVYAKAIPNAIFAALVSDLLAGTCDTFTTISYTFGGMEYGGVPTLGFQFLVEGVKTKDAVS